MNFVLMHGGFLGPWAWDQVAFRLRRSGHEVFTPILTGPGDRAHLLTPEVDLNTHVTDVINVLESEQLEDIVLVGHSYSGMVVAGVADRVPHRIAALVYVDALVPQTGQSYFDLADPELVRMLRQAADKHGESWKIPVVLTAEMFGITGPEAARIDSLAVPHPRKTLEEPISLIHSETHLPTIYIVSTRPSSGDAFVKQVERARSLGWSVRELPTGHMPMITMPDELSRLLTSVCNKFNVTNPES
jgi:pimeloyl-ACP methyl ester carboxylesterase